MRFDYAESFCSANDLEGYERLLLEAMLGNQALFTRSDGIERLWEISMPLLDDPPPVVSRTPGSWGPAACHELVAVPLAPAGPLSPAGRRGGAFGDGAAGYAPPKSLRQVWLPALPVGVGPAPGPCSLRMASPCPRRSTPSWLARVSEMTLRAISASCQAVTTSGLAPLGVSRVGRDAAVAAAGSGAGSGAAPAGDGQHVAGVEHARGAAVGLGEDRPGRCRITHRLVRDRPPRVTWLHDVGRAVRAHLLLDDPGGGRRARVARLASTAARKVSMSQLFAPLMAPNRLGPAGSTLRAGAHS